MLWLRLLNLTSVCQEMEIKTLGYILAMKIRDGRVSTNKHMIFMALIVF
jgi:hypothetical protein